MDELRHLDEVAYVRFASVYRSFQDLEAFRDEIDRLRHRRGRRDAVRDVAAMDQLPLLTSETAAQGTQVSTFDAQDRAFMARALALAAHGLATAHPNPRVGCVLVREGAIVAEGWHERAGGPHAEAAGAGQSATRRAAGATAYVTLEPCNHHGRTPPCSEALIKAGVARVVYAVG